MSVATEIEGVETTFAGFFDNFEGMAKKIEGIGNTLEGFLDNFEGIANGLLPESRTVVKCSSGSETMRAEHHEKKQTQ